MPAIMVYCTASSLDEARKLTAALVEEKLAACVSVVPQVKSMYWWKGNIEQAEEALMLIKTGTGKFEALKRRILQMHSYTVPEILAVPIVKGNPSYLKWLNESVNK